MRTTILLDDELAERFRKKAREEGKSLSAFLADAGRRVLDAPSGAGQERFDLLTYGKGGALDGIDLDRTSELLAAEDAERYKG